MSFSSRMKNELCRIKKPKSCCCMAEFAGVVCFAGTIRHLNKEVYLKINTENPSVARRIFNLIKWNFYIQSKVNIKKSRTTKHINNYSIYIRGRNNLNKILKSLKLIGENEDYKKLINLRIHKELVKQNCCKQAFIRGAFLGSGSMTDPEKTYHLEFVTHHYLLSQDLCNILSDFRLNAKTVLRKSNYVVYFKGSGNIVDLLNIIGAHQSLLELENIRIMKEMRNNVNRLVNCETANLDKTVNASMKQIQSIEFIQKKIGIDKLPENLQEIALLRMEHQEATLKELGEMLRPPIGKSGVNHRLRKIQQIAEELATQETHTNPL